jgi:hypothetical protein
MSGWSRMRAALRNLAHRQRAESDLDAEVRACAEMLADEKMAGGIPAEEAWRRSLAELGGAEQVKQAVRDERAGAGVEELWHDVRFGLRQLRRSPGFAATGLLIIAMGLGVTTAMYSIVYAVILKPLPFTQPYRLVAVGSKPWRSFSLPTMRIGRKTVESSSRSQHIPDGRRVSNRRLEQVTPTRCWCRRIFWAHWVSPCDWARISRIPATRATASTRRL